MLESSIKSLDSSSNLTKTRLNNIKLNSFLLEMNLSSL